ncbi:MAG: HlyC/CorC family transporter [Butyrivibrio sp.]|nr:HlyC/CorC family transporter [Butyrivibrio sp.]
MDSDIWIQWIILIILLLLSAFFSSAETALVSTNRVRMQSLAEEGDKRAARVLRILDDYTKMLSAILIGNNIVNLTASALTTLLAERIWGNMAVSIATGVLTVVVLINGEIVPKTIAAARAEQMALAYAGCVQALMWLLTPVIAVVNGVASVVVRLFGAERIDRLAMTEREFRTYVDVSHEDGAIEAGEKEIINNALDFSDTVAKDVMIPRIDMSCVEADAEYHEVMRIFRQDMYTRIPVYEDNRDNIIGLVNVKDLLLVQDRDSFHARDVLRGALYTYEYKKTADLMLEMREKAQNVAFVLSEYGATVGMITLEDLLEEIVGEIRDEYDSDEEELIKEIGEGRYLIEANQKLDDINDVCGTNLHSEDYDSIGGLMIEQLDRLPRGGESVTLEDGTVLTARGIKRNRITKVALICHAK